MARCAGLFLFYNFTLFLLHWWSSRTFGRINHGQQHGWLHSENKTPLNCFDVVICVSHKTKNNRQKIKRQTSSRKRSWAFSWVARDPQRIVVGGPWSLQSRRGWPVILAKSSWVRVGSHKVVVAQLLTHNENCDMATTHKPWDPQQNF